MEELSRPESRLEGSVQKHLDGLGCLRLFELLGSVEQAVSHSTVQNWGVLPHGRGGHDAPEDKTCCARTWLDGELKASCMPVACGRPPRLVPLASNYPR